MANYNELRVWKLGMIIVNSVHELTQSFPRTGAGELKSQMKRAAISIPSNIAEGANRSHDADFRRFLLIALGSCGELSTQVHIALALQYADGHICDRLAESLDYEGKMLRRLIQKLEVQ